MHAEDKNTNQAEELRELFLQTEENTAENTDNTHDAEEVDLREIDVLDLPPRKEVHINSQRTKLKISRPFIRLFFVSLLVILVLIGAFVLFDGEIVSLLRE